MKKKNENIEVKKRNFIDINEVLDFIYSKSSSTKIYIGCDSSRYKIRGVWHADYALVVIVHVNGKNGCKIFGEIQTEKDYEQRKGQPSYRLMNEVYKVSELYIKLADVIHDRSIEVHLDINPNKKYGSSCVIDQAIGYVRGVCQTNPVIKPDGFAAQHAADHVLKHRSMINS